METMNSWGNSSHRIALIGNFLPRRCGIATFTTDLLAALGRSRRGVSVMRWS
jgi:hypothetical protein